MKKRGQTITGFARILLPIVPLFSNLQELGLELGQCPKTWSQWTLTRDILVIKFNLIIKANPS